MKWPVRTGYLAPYSALAPITITRPNNVTAYTIGDVYGAAVDARITLAFGLPPGTLFFANLYIVRQRAPVTANQGVTVWPFIGAPPATIIADNDPLTLSDADINLLVKSGISAQVMIPGVTSGVNFSADPNGRVLSSGAGIYGIMPATGDGNVYVYLMKGAAYVPLALEECRLFAFWLVF
jgi:hypothetical protein